MGILIEILAEVTGVKLADSKYDLVLTSPKQKYVPFFLFPSLNAAFKGLFF